MGTNIYNKRSSPHDPKERNQGGEVISKTLGVVKK